MATVPTIRGTQASGAAVSSGIINDTGTLAQWLAGQGTPATANRPYAQVRQITTPTSLVNNAYTAVVWDTVDYDTANGAAATSANYTCQYAGLYYVEAVVGFTGNATGARYLQIWKNGAAVGVATGWQNAPGGGGFYSVAITGMIRCAVNDTISIAAFQSSGAALNTNAGGAGGLSSQMHVIWIGA